MILALYRLLAPLLAALLPAAALFAPKLRATLAWRRECPADPDALALPDRSPRYWLHAASAGELEQALPLLGALREKHPDAALLLTLSSASARRAAARVEDADLAIPLPADTRGAMDSLFAAFRPDALLLVKWDLWPNLLLAANAGKVPTLLLGGVLSPDSGRARFPGRLLARPLHGLLAAVGAASAADAGQFLEIGVPAARVEVTGDTRFDRVLARRDEGRPLPLARGEGAGPCLVAGSTWPAEEELLLTAFATLRVGYPDLCLLLVPHEPTAGHLAELEAAAAKRELPLWRMSKRAKLSAGICVVDRTGILPELYALGEIALVGGGFGRGIHSVLEPAAYGLPVLMGPNRGRADEARRLAEAGGAFPFHDAAGLRTLWEGWLADPASLRAAGESAIAFVAAERGACSRSMDLIERQVPRS